MKFEIYKDAKGEWRWRLKARNGEIIADSAESYHNKGDVETIIKKIKSGVAFADTVTL